MKRISILIVAAIVCTVIWTAVIFSFLKASEATEEIEITDQVEVIENKPNFPVENPAQIARKTPSEHFRETGITVEEARKFAPNQEISVDELLDIINGKEAGTH